jgi:cytochrome c556
MIIALVLVGLPAIVSAQHPYRLTEQQMKSLIERIAFNADRFRKSLDDALDKGRIDGTRAEDNINQFMKDFEDASDRLKDRYGDNQTAARSVEEVLQRTVAIDNFMWRHRLTPRAQDDWQRLRGDLEQLAQAYHVAWGWLGPIGQAHRVSEDQMKSLISEIEINSDRFRKSLDDALDETRFNSTRAEDNINQFVKEFEETADRLKGRFDDDNAAIATVHEILRRAARIDAFMRQHRLTLGAQNDWRSLRSNLDRLATGYRLSWRWY